MVVLIKNIHLTRRAAPEFEKRRLAFRPRPGEVFALVWVFKFVDANGVTAPGFEPGYMCGPIYAEGLDEHWALAQLPDGSQFYFMPRAWLDDSQSYVVDKQGGLFSIGPTS